MTADFDVGGAVTAEEGSEFKSEFAKEMSAMSASKHINNENNQSNRNVDNGMVVSDVAVDNSVSYLDDLGVVSLQQMRHMCGQLGFEWSASEWSKMSSVNNADFFQALVTHIVRSKQRNHFNNKETNSSPCGMPDAESCRSSDSGLEREIGEREKEIANCHQDIAQKEAELVRVRLECQRLLEENRRLRRLGDARRRLELENEVDNLQWQLQRLQSSRKTYELATQRLVSFLDEVTNVLYNTSPAQRKMLDETRREVLNLPYKRNNRRSIYNNRKFKLDENSSMALSVDDLNGEISSGTSRQSSISRTVTRAESMPMGLDTLEQDKCATPVKAPPRRRPKRAHSTHGRPESAKNLMMHSKGGLERVLESDDCDEKTKTDDIRNKEIEKEREEIDQKRNNNGKNEEENRNESRSERRKNQSHNNEQEEQKMNKCQIRNEQNTRKSRKDDEEERKEGKNEKLDTKKSNIDNTSSSSSSNSTMTRRPVVSKTVIRLGRPSRPKSILNEKEDNSDKSLKEDKNEEQLKEEGEKDREKRREQQLQELHEQQEKQQQRQQQRQLQRQQRQLGDLHMEPALPSMALRVSNEQAISSETDELVGFSRKLIRSVRSLLAREKTLDINHVVNENNNENNNDTSDSVATDARPNLQLISHSRFPGLPAFPVLAASHSSPWNC